MEGPPPPGWLINRGSKISVLFVLDRAVWRLSRPHRSVNRKGLSLQFGQVAPLAGATCQTCCCKCVYYVFDFGILRTVLGVKSLEAFVPFQNGGHQQ